MPRHQPLLHHRSRNFAGQTCGDSPIHRTRLNLAAALSLILTLPALAQQSPCALNPHDSSCGFDRTLHFLYWLAAALAILLVLIIALALAAYRKNKHSKLTPDD
jgi:hypothetical protein